jgi:hypothetical protein
LTWLTELARTLLYRSKLALSIVASLKAMAKYLRSYVRDGIELPTPTVVHQGEAVLQGPDTVILIASHRRNSILVSLINYYTRNLTSLRYVLLVVISDDDDSPIFLLSKAAKKNLVVLRVGNRPVGNKWQQGVSHARSLGPRSLMICGSDDFITPEYMSRAISMSRDYNFGVVGCNSWMVVEKLENKQRLYSVQYTGKSLNQLLGAGRLYSSGFLEICDWTIFEKRFDKGLDYKGVQLAQKNKVTIGVCEAAAVVSVKGDWDMINPFSKLASSDFVEVTELSKKLNCIAGCEDIVSDSNVTLQT